MTNLSSFTVSVLLFQVVFGASLIRSLYDVPEYLTKRESLQFQSVGPCISYQCVGVGNMCINSISNYLNNTLMLSQSGDSYGPLCNKKLAFGQLNSQYEIDCENGVCVSPEPLQNRGSICNLDADCGYYVSPNKVIYNALYCFNGACDLDGYLNIGDDCTSDYQCSNGVCSSGKCLQTIGSCSSFGDSCEWGYYCANQTCIKQQSVGQACFDSSECEFPAICVPDCSSDQSAAKCVLPFSLLKGETCSLDFPLCEFGLSCSYSTETCVYPEDEVTSLCTSGSSCSSLQDCTCDTTTLDKRCMSQDTAFPVSPNCEAHYDVKKKKMYNFKALSSCNNKKYIEFSTVPGEESVFSIRF
eukprot:TRINITY_DN5400_c0_g1_i2.p1 TRINITY_DN5400_c0_g1~~TRINITY_DN5400_c0_g1_i2.p1  ORF type:complete len:378 (+),score=52.37 TRINITY_DN5400_c0_g1_i2:68-1135(+)